MLGHADDDTEINESDLSSSDEISDDGEIEEADRNATPSLATSERTGSESREGRFAESNAGSSTSQTRSRVLTPKERLVATGVRFIDENLEPRLPVDEAQTYYVITLTWLARRKQ